MGRSGRAGGCCPKVVAGASTKGHPGKAGSQALAAPAAAAAPSKGHRGEAGSQAVAAPAAAAAPSPEFVAAKALVLDGGGLLAPELLS
eukprot:11445981-Alexandrium_andersonii.AAC.1